MPSLGHVYVNCSAELAEQRERLRQKKIQSWERMKQAVAAKYSAT